MPTEEKQETKKVNITATITNEIEFVNGLKKSGPEKGKPYSFHKILIAYKQESGEDKYASVTASNKFTNDVKDLKKGEKVQIQGYSTINKQNGKEYENIL